MNIVLKIMGIKSQEPPIEYGDDGLPRAMCYSCHYWSGRAGNAPSDLVCAVNVPEPTKEELDRAGGRPAYTYHDCPDFERKPQPESRTIQLH